MKSLRKAFSLVEVVLVIIVLGVVSSIVSTMFTDVYRSYLLQRSVERSTLQSEIAAQQIANRLTNRISISTIGKNPSDQTDFKAIDQLPENDTTHRVLEWIAYDEASFSAKPTPGWSGFCDINSSQTTRTSIETPGSDLDFADTVISNLGGSITDGAVIFLGQAYAPTINYQPNCLGYIDSSCISPITDASGTSISVSDDNAKTVHDQYVLVWSAYAIVPVDNGDGSFDLELHYNYQPWKGEDYTNGRISTLARNVTVFKFKGSKSGDIVRFKICVRERLGDQNISSCKEKAVIR